MKQSTRVHHVAIEVSDMDRSIQFYRDLLGLKLTERHPASVVPEIPVELTFLRFHENHHDFVLAHNPNKQYRPAAQATEDGPAACHHVAIQMSDRTAWCEQLDKAKELDAPIVRGPIVHSAYQPEGDGSWGENESFYVVDPDGHRIEFFCNMASVDDDGFVCDSSGKRLASTCVDEP